MFKVIFSVLSSGIIAFISDLLGRLFGINKDEKLGQLEVTEKLNETELHQIDAAHRIAANLNTANDSDLTHKLQQYSRDDKGADIT